MCSRSDTPGSRGASIRIALILSVQTAIITVENTIGFQPAPEIERAIFFVRLHNELDIVICIHRTMRICHYPIRGGLTVKYPLIAP